MTVGVCYCTREDVQRALDSATTARNEAQVDRAIRSATASVDALCQRTFVPETATRYFPWPDEANGRTPWRLWLADDEVVSVTTLAAGGTTIPSTDYYLEPINSGPPYTSIEVDVSSPSAFDSGDSWQRSIVVTGVFGYSADTEAAGSLAEALDDSETGVDVSNSAAIGVGDLILVDNERMLVTGKSMLTTGQTLQTALTASNSNVTVAVTTGSAFNAGETILLDSERMLVVDIAGNNLTVRRAWDGSVLAAHTGSTIYAPRTLTVVRGAQGTTAASHLTSTAIYRHYVPPLIRDLAIAYAMTELLQESAGYARTAGQGEAQREVIGRGLRALEQQAMTRYGRQMRTRAV